MRFYVFHLILVLLFACVNNDASHIADFENSHEPGRLYGRVSQLPGRTVLLYELYGDQVNPLDTAVAGSDGSFEFVFPTERELGLYRIAMGKSTAEGEHDMHLQQFDIIWDGSMVIFNTSYLHPVDSMEITFSGENRLYYQFLRRMNKFDKKIGALNYALLNYPPEDRFYRRIERQHRRVQNQRLNYIDNLISKNGETIFSSIAYFRKPPRLSSPGDSGQIDVLRHEFFREGQFTDPVLLRTDLIPKKIIRYLSLFATGGGLDNRDTQEEMIVAVDIIMDHAMANEEVYYFVAEYLINGFESMDMEQVSEHITRRYLLGDICFEEGKMLDQKSLSSIEKLEEGDRVPGFSFTSLGGRQVDLHDIDARYTLILFYGSWCPHCKDVMDDLSELYAEFHNENENFLEIVAIGVEDDKQAWLDYIEKGGYNWVNYSALQRWDCEIARDYGLKGTPTMILLNSDKRFIQEPQRVRALNRYLSRRQ